MRAVIVSVGFADLLALSLEYNSHHFDDVMVITSPDDIATHDVANSDGAKLWITDIFYARGAKFAKYAAIEQGLDAFGRDGWLALLDADTFWPSDASFSELTIGKLYTPRRRMMIDATKPIPPESEWSKFAIHPGTEFAGYSQVFHASDPVLGLPPWHDITWATAGGGDSFFQQKWKPENKIRPPFEVLHVGESGVNWLGRASRLTDGTIPDGAAERRAELRRLIRMRKQGPGRFDAEKIP